MWTGEKRKGRHKERQEEISTLLQARLNEKYTLFQTETVICIPCSRVGARKVYPVERHIPVKPIYGSEVRENWLTILYRRTPLWSTSIFSFLSLTSDISYSEKNLVIGSLIRCKTQPLSSASPGPWRERSLQAACGSLALGFIPVSSLNRARSLLSHLMNCANKCQPAMHEREGPLHNGLIFLRLLLLLASRHLFERYRGKSGARMDVALWYAHAQRSHKLVRYDVIAVKEERKELHHRAKMSYAYLFKYIIIGDTGWLLQIVLCFSIDLPRLTVKLRSDRAAMGNREYAIVRSFILFIIWPPVIVSSCDYRRWKVMPSTPVHRQALSARPRSDDRCVWTDLAILCGRRDVWIELKLPIALFV